jgi:hypothetical protein
VTSGYNISSRYSGCKKSRVSANVTAIDSSVLLKLKNLNKVQFIGLPADSFLSQPIVSTYKKKFFLEEPERLALRYNEGIYMHICVFEKSFIRDINNIESWDFENFRSARVSQIVLLFKGDTIQTIGKFPSNDEKIFLPNVDTVFSTHPPKRKTRH